VFIQTLVYKSRDDPDLGDFLCKVVNPFRACNEVEEEDAVLGNTFALQDLDGHDCTTTGGKHRVEQEYPAVLNIGRELIIEELGFAGLLVALDQDLANADGATAFPQTLLHRLARSHDGHAANLTLEPHPNIIFPNRRGHGVGDNWEVVEAFFNQEANNAVRVEDEIGPLGVLVPDHGQKGDQLWRLGEDMDIFLLHLPRNGGSGLFSFRAIRGPDAHCRRLDAIGAWNRGHGRMDVQVIRFRGSGFKCSRDSEGGEFEAELRAEEIRCR
jgi:hypothetical protein